MRLIVQGIVFAAVVITGCGNGEMKNRSASEVIASSRSPSDHVMNPDEIRYIWYMGTWFKVPWGHNLAALSSSTLRINPTLTKNEVEVVLAKDSAISGYDLETRTFDPSLVEKPGLPPTFVFCNPGASFVNIEYGNDKKTNTKCAEHNDSWVEVRPEWPFLERNEFDSFSKLFRQLGNQKQRKIDAEQAGVEVYWETGNRRDDWDPAKHGHVVSSFEPGMEAYVECRPGALYLHDFKRYCFGIVWEARSNLGLYIRFEGGEGSREASEFVFDVIDESVKLVKKLRQVDQ